jgi:hypothetical protein
MICGVKWKSCDCPWFNYDAVEEDRLNHMRVPGVFEEMPGPARLVPPRRRQRTYHEEMDARRQQELRDGGLAERLQNLDLDDADDYNGGIGDIHGIGNGQNHFMNETYQRPAPRPNRGENYVENINRARGLRAVSPIASPALRPRDTRAAEYNIASTTRPAERVAPARLRRDYESEAATHAPASVRREVRNQRRTSVLAGLGGRSKGTGRVDAWRTHVEPGLEAAQVLSM